MGALIDALASLFGWARIWVVVSEDERGIVLRRGIFRRELEPGWHWLMPIVDDALVDNIKPQIVPIGEQSLTTRDGRAILITVNIRRIITDMRAACLEVEDFDESTAEVCQGCVGELVMGSTWVELLDMDLAEEIRLLCEEECSEFGAGISDARIKDLVVARTLRIVNA